MSHYKPYPAYKDSGVEWIGRVPEHWELKRLRHLAPFANSGVDKKSYEGQQPVKLCNYTDVYYNEFIVDSLPFMDATASDDEIARFTLKPGDVLMTKDSEDPSDIGIPAFVADDMPGVICGYHLTVIRAGNANLGGYIHRSIQAHPTKAHFFVESPGITRYGLSQDAIGDIVVCLPPSEERQTIVAALDRETARIDALIGKKTRFIELLKEKRQALITHAVTQGLDPTVKMKDSGVAWIGEVPEHWTVPKLRHVAAVQTGTAKGKDVHGVETVLVPYLRVANVQDGYLDLTDVAQIEIPKAELSRYLLRSGDVLMNEGGDNDKLGRGDVWRGEIDPCIHQNHVFAVRPYRLSSDWLNTYTGSSVAQAFFASMAKQTTNLASISSSSLMDLPVPRPPAEEQVNILAHNESLTARIDKLIAKSEHSILLLKERRSALITAAVTGQIDLRDTATTTGTPA